MAVTADASNISTKSQAFYAGFDMIIACDLNFSALQLINTACRVVNRPFYATGLHGFYGFIFADLIEHEFIIQRQQSNIAPTIGPESVTRRVTGVTNKVENGKPVQVITKVEQYTHLLMANSSPLPAVHLKSMRKLRGVTPLLPAMRALWAFERSTGRLPSHSHEDLVGFTSTADGMVKELQLPAHTLKAEFLRKFLTNIGSEITATAAFVGGRLAEDVINVLGRREQPIQNLVLFDGDEFQAPVYALHPASFEQLPHASSNGNGSVAAQVGAAIEVI